MADVLGVGLAMSNIRHRVDLALAQSLGPNPPPSLDLTPSEWEELWVSARDHCLVPYLHERWLEAGGLQALPPDIARRFSDGRQENTERNQRMLFLLGELLSALQERRIATLVSKGLPLAQAYYGDLGLRVLYDLDLIIKAEDAEQAFDVLRRIGYEPFFSGCGNELGRPLWRPRAYSWDAEHVFDPDRPVLVELHTSPWQRHWHGFRIESGLDLWQDRRLVEVAGLKLSVPAEEQLLVHLAVHYACNVLECSARLMHLLDIVLVLRQRGSGLDWKTVVKLINENRLEPFCFVAFDLAARTGGCSPPQSVWSPLRDATPSPILNWLESRAVRDVCSMSLRNRNRSLIYFLHWNMAQKWPEKASLLLYSLRGPWHEGTGLGRWKSLAVRTGLRLRHLAHFTRITGDTANTRSVGKSGSERRQASCETRRRAGR